MSSKLFAFSTGRNLGKLLPSHHLRNVHISWGPMLVSGSRGSPPHNSNPVFSRWGRGGEMLEQLTLLKGYTIWETELGNTFTLYDIPHVVGTPLTDQREAHWDSWVFPCANLPLHVSPEFCLDETEGSEKILCIPAACSSSDVYKEGQVSLDRAPEQSAWDDVTWGTMHLVVREGPLLSGRWGVFCLPLRHCDLDMAQINDSFTRFISL